MQSYLLLSLIGLISCGALLVAAQTEVNDVLSALENFGEDNGMRTGFTLDQYELVFRGLYDRFKKVAATERPGADMTRLRILHDFILTPMNRWRPAENDDEVTKQAYVNRMEQAFKRFYPAYVHFLPIGSMKMFTAEQFNHFLDSMKGKNREEPTLAMWQEANKEHEGVEARIEEIVTREDIYENLDELELKMNFINNFDVFYLVQNFADRLNECKSDADLKEIVAEYRMRSKRA